MRTDQILLAAFGTASSTRAGLSGWTHAYGDPGFLTGEYYAKLARTVEEAGFDLLFFDDRLAVPAVYGDSHRSAVELGSRAVKLDLAVVLGIAAAVTGRIGLGATYSTTYHNPYHVARVFATLDHLSGGRAIWNIVTSLNHEEARNFGHSEHMESAARYDRADEFMDVVTGLWETWSRDAVLLDRDSGRFADPDLVKRLDFAGSNYSSQGPLTVPRPPQGWPTLLQAGQSGRGQEFATKWADLTFTVPQTIERAQKQYEQLHGLLEQSQRPSNALKVLPAISVVVGETTEAAEAKRDYIYSRIDPIEELISISEITGIDFATISPDQKLTDELVAEVAGSKGILQAQLNGARAHFGDDPTSIQLGQFLGYRTSSRFVGNGREVAERMAEWFNSNACDGFVVSPSHTPGAFEDVGRLVMPHLQKMGLKDEGESTPQTFRERHNLARRDS